MIVIIIIIIITERRRLKCMRYGFKLVNYNDSAWPAANLTEKNNQTATINTWNWSHPVEGISNDAYWIWSTDFDNTLGYNFALSQSGVLLGRPIRYKFMFKH